MTPLSTRMVEAAARAICRKRCPGAHPCDMESTYCKPDKCSRWHVWTDEAHAAITAALALAEAEGAMLCVVGAEIEGAGPLLVADNDRMRLGMVSARASGWNAHRAATLAGRVRL